MKKVVNVSVGGRSFSLDEDAYARLLTYFDHFKARLDRDTQSAKEEVMADLENRIAELFDQGTGGASYRVVNLALVAKVVEQLGMPDGSKEPKESESGTNARDRIKVPGRKMNIQGPDQAWISPITVPREHPAGGFSVTWTTRPSGECAPDWQRFSMWTLRLSGSCPF